MEKVSDFFGGIFNALTSVDKSLLIIISLASFGAVFIIALVFCLVSKRARASDKRPFLYAVNAFTAVNFSILSQSFNVSAAAATAAAFWCAGYLLYGFLCLLGGGRQRGAKSKSRENADFEGANYANENLMGGYDRSRLRQGGAQGRQSRAPFGMPSVSMAQSGVRLEHALSISDKLLIKNLGRGDRQELEKIKTSLTVLKVKEELTPQECEQLNDAFNALLKLMAKYDL